MKKKESILVRDGKLSAFIVTKNGCNDKVVLVGWTENIFNEVQRLKREYGKYVIITINNITSESFYKIWDIVRNSSAIETIECILNDLNISFNLFEPLQRQGIIDNHKTSNMQKQTERKKKSNRIKPYIYTGGKQ